MTERHLGERNNFFFAKVVSNKDEKQSGRLQIRVFGLQDDTTNIPDEKLYWAAPLQPVTSAAHKQIGSSPVGAKEGTVIMGMWADRDKTIPIVMGTMASAGQPQSNTNTTVNGQPPLDANKNDLPHNTRDARAAGRDFNPVLANNHVVHAMANMNFNTQRTVATTTPSQRNQDIARISGGDPLIEAEVRRQRAEAFGNVSAQAYEIDPQNSSGAIPGATRNVVELQSIANGINQITSIGINQIPSFLTKLAGASILNLIDNIGDKTTLTQLLINASQISSAIMRTLNMGNAVSGNVARYSVPSAISSSVSRYNVAPFQMNLITVSIMNSLEDFVSNPLQFFSNIINNLISFFDNIVNSIGNVITDIMNFMNNVIGSFTGSNENVDRVPTNSEQSIRNTLQETQRRIVTNNVIGERSRNIFNV